MRSLMMLALAALVLLTPASTLADDPPKGKQAKLSGEVVEVRQQTMLHNEGEFTEIKIRTRNQQERWLRLGPSADCPNCVQVGDQVRAKVMGANAGEPARVRTMWNDSTGQRMRLRDGSGKMLNVRVRTRLQDGTGGQARDRDRGRDGRGSGNQGGGQSRGGQGSGNQGGRGGGCR